MKMSKRARRAGLAVGTAVLATMAFGASSASAAPFSTTFNYGYVNLGNSFPNTQILDGVTTSTLTGDETAGAITAGTIEPITRVLNPAPGITATSTLTQDGATPITGTYNSGTGALTLNITFDISVVVAGAGPNDGTCNYNDVAYVFDTANTVPHAGEPYDNAGGLAGNGAVSDAANLPAGTGDPATCGFLGVVLGADPDEADVWLGSNILPSDAPVPFNQAFESGRLNVGLLTNINIDAANPRFVNSAGSSVVQGTAGGSSASTVTIQPSAFAFDPVATAPTGTPLSVDLALDSPITTGSFDAATGEMTLPGIYTATVTVRPGEGPPNEFDCVSQANPINLSTENPQGSSPAPGTRFAGLAGPGALSASWPTLDQDGSANCALIDGAGFFPSGGMWIGRGITPPENPPDTTTSTTTVPTTPTTTTNNNNNNKKKKCKKAKKKKKGKKGAAAAGCKKKKKKKKGKK